FATAEVCMNLLGAGLGVLAGRAVGGAAGYVGFAVLILLGAYMMLESREAARESSRFDLSSGWGLFLGSLTISLDSLGVGFSILYVGVPMPVSLAAIAVVSVCATACGLAIGGRLGRFADRYAAFSGGLLLALTGAAFLVLKALHLG
ncbi:MAG TPA: manganese efflux pump, partial [Verrucomicrobiae bacterium]|nr:manganese efflux pump [Verrucomicrobiae bacterium]